MTSQELFDRFQAFQHDTEWTVDATAEYDSIINLLVVKGFITSVAMRYLQEEFEHCYLSDYGLVVGD